MASQKMTNPLSASKRTHINQQSYSNSLISSNEMVTTSTGHELAQDLIYYLDSILSEEVGIIAARPLLDAFIAVLRSLTAETKIKVGQHAITLLQARSASVKEQDSQIREILADALRIPGRIHIRRPPPKRLVSNTAKARLWIRIVRYYLEDDDTTSAEAFLNRIENLPSEIEDHDSKLSFQLSQARILDARRRFLDAAQEYFKRESRAGVDEEDRLTALSAAIRCAVLAPAGPQRSRSLARLYKDDRTPSVDEFVAAFAKKVASHQLAVTADGTAVLDKAVIEHNLVAASKLYEAIHVDDLGLILGLQIFG
ncbi:hypothetical protein N7530_010702 [Penicillium desertorum]|uniref:PSMD12/CSN4-like N-terminal domain-containing protein n=1 Tax=Penicillium desertorum TaxID=1303715 RepID=A0A9W9WIG0_9EURO|nr:hypothetical protein N7530_010702 [Penicillium desertorum]